METSVRQVVAMTMVEVVHVSVRHFFRGHFGMLAGRCEVFVRFVPMENAIMSRFSLAVG